MKVVWICHFSNPQIRERLNLSVNVIEVFARKMLKKPKNNWIDFAAWITNGIDEFEKFDDIELHVVSPHYGMANKIETFQLNRINYHFFKPCDDSILKKNRDSFLQRLIIKFIRNSKIIGVIWRGSH